MISAWWITDIAARALGTLIGGWPLYIESYTENEIILSVALGTCWAIHQTYEVHFSVYPPQAICSTHMGQELLRLEAAEIASLIRTYAEIPTIPSPEEKQRRLDQQLDKERSAARNDIFTAAGTPPSQSISRGLSNHTHCKH